MSVETDLFEQLRALVSDRAYPDTFPQGVVWPAIRFTHAGGTIDPDICGSGDEDTDSPRIQVDIVAATRAARAALVTQVRTAMMTFEPAAVLDGPPLTEYDAETKTYRASLDFLIFGSSVAGP